jgi:hypothetical protein
MADNKECNVCKKFIKSKYKPLKVWLTISAICNVLLIVAFFLK